MLADRRYVKSTMYCA